MAGCSGLLPDFPELLNIHRPISRGRHLDKMPQQPRDMKTGETRLCHGAYFELGHFRPGPLIAVLFRYARAIWAFRLFERFLAYLWRELINLYSRRGFMRFWDDTYALGAAGG